MTWFSLYGLLSDPVVGTPILLLLITLAAWLVANRRRFRSAEHTRTTWQRPDRDAVSQAYYAVEDRRYSRLVRAVYDRFDRAVHARYAIGLADLGWRPWRTPARGIGLRKDLLAARDELSRRYTEAVGREQPFRVRLAFWRSFEEDERRYLGRVDRAVARVESMVHQLEGTT